MSTESQSRSPRSRNKAHPASAKGVDMQVRFFFAVHFLWGGRIFAKRASEMESSLLQPDAEQQAEHLSLVVSTVIQSVSALDAEVYDVIHRGPGFHLGSSGIDRENARYLQGLGEVLGGHRGILERYQNVLHLLRRPKFDPGKEPFQSAHVLVNLRNAIVHYKAKATKEMEDTAPYSAFQARRWKAPPFYPDSVNFFPHRCLSAACASWAVDSAVAFIDEFYALLGIPSRLESWRERLMVGGSE